jgi:hypothetical protein
MYASACATRAQKKHVAVSALCATRPGRELDRLLAIAGRVAKPRVEDQPDGAGQREQGGE